jgi:hypothetical protein
MLVASLGYTGRPYRRRGGERYDVGNGVMMTVSEISMASGCDRSTIYGRIAAGDTGPALLRPLRAKLFDCGGEMLTIKQIMARTGLSEPSVRSRISRGVKGGALLKKERRDMAAPRSSTMVLACRLADAFPDRLPTTKEIRRLYPMAEGTAERWLAALRAARDRA